MRLGYSIPTIVVGTCAILTVATAGVFVVLQATTGRQPNLTGRVQLGTDSCQSFIIDHKTGFISHDQRAACDEAAKEAKRKGPKQPVVVPIPEQAGARLETVRDSFNKR